MIALATSSRVSRFCRTALVIGLLMAPCGRGEAAPSGRDEAARRAARPYAEKGFELFSSGEYAESLEQFRRAEARYHAPPHLLYMARALRRLGRLVEARGLYQRILDDRVDEAAPQAFHRAVVEARAEVGELVERIPTVVLEISGTSLDRATVVIDGRHYGALPETIPLDPGEHSIEVTAPGAATEARSIELEPGETRRIPIALRPEAGEGAAAPFVVPGLVCLGVGGASLLVSAITGGVSLSEAADIDDQCQGDRCPPTLEGDADRAKTLGHVSTATFVLGLATAAAGATLLFVAEGREDEPTLALHLSASGIGLVGVY